MTRTIKRAAAACGTFLIVAIVITIQGQRVTFVTAAAPIPPNPPSGCDAVAQTAAKININWVDNSTNETGFKIERCTGASCTNFVQVAQVGVNATTYSNIGLVANTAYRYRVRSYQTTLGNSTYSNIDNATTYPTGQSCTETPCP